MTTFETRSLSCGYDGHAVLSDVELGARAGELIAVIGPNGAGKSTLLRTLVGLLPPVTGEVRIANRATEELSRRELARLVAFVPQGIDASFPFAVRELVAMGRTPWLGRFQPETTADKNAIAEAMLAADVMDLADRHVPELSGGERQRVVLARAFAQRAPALVLDEPTANLDLRHAFELLELVRRRADDGATVLAAVHDLPLACRFADRLLVLHGGRIASDGPPEEVLTPALMRDVFGVDAEVEHREGAGLSLTVWGTVGEVGDTLS